VALWCAALAFTAIVAFVAGFITARQAPRILAGIAPPPSVVPAPPPPEAPPLVKPGERLVLTPAEFGDLAGWGEDDVAPALGAFRRSCGKLNGQQPDLALVPGDKRFGTNAQWRTICAALPDRPDKAAARAFVERWFRPFRAANNDTAEGLFTGYYEPELKGARERGGHYTVPLYRTPADLVQIDLGQFLDEMKGRSIAGRLENGRLRPYADRAVIEAGHLKDKGLELLWVDDPVDAFFLQVQGAGKVTLPDGGAVRVGFAAHNGHGFIAIGKLLVDSGKIARERVSMQAVRDWLRANPEEARALMAKNPRYIFFKDVTPEAVDGPLGAQGVALTAGRSLAVDRRYVPLGVPIWLDTTMPGSTDRKLRRLVVAQDTGGAITGPVRGDFYWGTGEAALAEAGRMRSTGRYFLLLPKGTP
jgi:membrane-bound lytic murein transglycosylase A